DSIGQWINMANIVKEIDKTAEYVVQIPAKYKTQFESGEFFINKNKTTGVEWPSLMRKTENGQYRFVDDLPIKQQEFIQGNPFQDMCNSYHNIVMQQQLAEIADTVADTFEAVKKIEEGQQDDRIALIDTGKEQIRIALTLQDERLKREMLSQGANNLFLGKEQIGKALQRRVDSFQALPESGAPMLLASIVKPGFLDKKDNEVEEIQDCYFAYIEATKLIAMTFAYVGELNAIEQTFRKSKDFIKGIDFTRIKSIESSHKGVDFSEWFFNKPVEYLETQKTPCIEATKEYDYIQIELSGEELLEVIGNGREEISETEVK
ncbi:MAG: (deoxy)nucleoside triphosphate pyrophosphohydrolase, partial [Candidatus Riflebacteria bacterium]|nr:(deoxy)nucleoside triphosphate pyrophosphohydrolase [Candidatus Riflebacteria bacterium]